VFPRSIAPFIAIVAMETIFQRSGTCFYFFSFQNPTEMWVKCGRYEFFQGIDQTDWAATVYHYQMHCVQHVHMWMYSVLYASCMWEMRAGAFHFKKWTSLKKSNLFIFMLIWSNIFILGLGLPLARFMKGLFAGLYYSLKTHWKPWWPSLFRGFEAESQWTSASELRGKWSGKSFLAEIGDWK
jgi:hypothetical protein